MAIETREGPTRRGLAIAAAVLGVSTAATLAIGWVLAASTPGMQALAVAALTVLATAAVGLASLIVGILAVVRARPRWPAIVGLAITVGVVLFLAARMLLV